jgi:hypothetical protein
MTLPLQKKLEALRGSITSWKQQYLKHGVEDCPCCLLAMGDNGESISQEKAAWKFFAMDCHEKVYRCTNLCLIGGATQQSGCRGSPYSDWAAAEELFERAEEAGDTQGMAEAEDAMRQHARQMIRFMKDIEQEVLLKDTSQNL